MNPLSKRSFLTVFVLLLLHPKLQRVQSFASKPFGSHNHLRLYNNPSPSKTHLAVVLPNHSNAILHHPNNKHHVATSLAGKLWPALQKFKIGPTKLKEIVKNILVITQWQDIVFLLLVAYATIPAAKWTFERSSDETKEQRSFTKLKRFSTSHWVSGVAKVALSVYLVDCICIALSTLGFSFVNQWGIPTIYAKSAYSIWGLRKFLAFKQAALCKLYKVEPDDMGRVEILDRLLTGFSVSIVSLLLFDWLSVRMGMAIKGLFAFGSVGTLAFTLASQGLVSQFISGVFLTAGNRVVPGEFVQFGDGTSGSVLKMGWMETIMRSPDNTIISVPNSKLADQKVSNFSRVRVSQVKQTLRFHYEDADEIPALVESIKEEIKKSCSRLIIDGSRPFRVFWTGFNEDHLEVMVDTHFNIAPIGDPYWINRQRVLMAISRAVKNHNLEFAQLYHFEPSGREPIWRVVPKPRNAAELSQSALPSSTSEANEATINTAPPNGVA